MSKEQVIKDFIDKYTTYLGAVKNTLIGFSQRNDMIIHISTHWDFGGTHIVTVTFTVVIKSCFDEENDDVYSQVIRLMFNYNLEYLKTYFQRKLDAGVLTTADLKATYDEERKINYLLNDAPGTITASISFWGENRSYEIEPHTVNLKDDRILRENLDEYYQQIIHFIDSHIQDMADGSEELIAFCQK